MTDNKIIKALECCINDDCDNCPDTFGNCEHNAMRNALNLINRQKSEIERLQSMNQAKLDIIHDIRAELETAKSEAIKEFTEKLKASQIITHRSKEGFCVYEFDDELIDTLVEEMTVNYESSTNDKQRKEDENEKKF